ncbi:acyltransferase [Microcoleus sp. FACHB-831]|uniref:acyltransferase family protein n=1 Tax=Microcoleus sp. FACHB-831 TaxID=2692827 RepID=UPI0016820814|nr:acyltransferase family protein [Microcoleus sp. FACHB-831]MBD1921406.1 acyltransferase [Microcoleus sp. FACHB-831]
MKSYTSETDVSFVQTKILGLLDFCKGLAIAWVFLFHCYRGGWFGWQGVHIFIVLSGFGLTYSCLQKGDNFSWKQWYIKRFEKVLPTYWVVCLFGFLIMLCHYIFTNEDIAKNFLKAAIQLKLDILVFSKLSHQTIFALPNSALWFIPLILGYYLVFPWLYTRTLKDETTKGYLSILLGVVALEFIYRGITIYWLDGFPIGYENRFDALSLEPIKPLNRLIDSWIMPFQLQAPFALFPSRIGEFMLGMIGAILLAKNPQKFTNIFLDCRMGLTGVFIWLAGYCLVYVGLWGWIFADFIISLGLVLWVVNLAWIFQQRWGFLFITLSQLGIWSYYIFLTHDIFVYVYWESLPAIGLDIDSLSWSTNNIVRLGFIMFGTWATSCLLLKFDKSRLPHLMIKNSLTRAVK